MSSKSRNPLEETLKSLARSYPSGVPSRLFLERDLLSVRVVFVVVSLERHQRKEIKLLRAAAEQGLKLTQQSYRIRSISGFMLYPNDLLAGKAVVLMGPVVSQQLRERSKGGSKPEVGGVEWIEAPDLQAISGKVEVKQQFWHAIQHLAS